MHYTFTMPPASRAADRPTPIDDALVAEVRAMLVGAVRTLAFAPSVKASQRHFSGPMAALCESVRSRGVPIEKLIVAIKLAWASIPDVRLRYGESATDALTGAVSACIEAYFSGERPHRAD